MKAPVNHTVPFFRSRKNVWTSTVTRYGDLSQVNGPKVYNATLIDCEFQGYTPCQPLSFRRDHKMFAALALTVLAGSAVANPLVSSFQPIDLLKRAGSGCSTSGDTSCHNTTAVKDTCCFESPGGLLLQTQFWDTDPAVSNCCELELYIEC